MRALLGIENTVVEDVEFDEEAQVLVAHVRPRRASLGVDAEPVVRQLLGMTVDRGGGGGVGWIWEPSRVLR